MDAAKKAGREVVLAEWDDHTFDFGTFSGTSKPMRLLTAGFLAYEDDKVVVIAMTKREDGSYAETQTIDRRMLTKLRRL